MPGDPWVFMDTEEPLARAAVAAIHTGDVPTLSRLLTDHPELAAVRLGDPGMSRSLLHVATDWPGNYPHGAEVVATLIAAGADVHARFTGPHTETPLHWAASSDDVPVLDTLLDAGADLEAPGAVIAGGTPLDDAVAFGQWKAAHRLVERGAHTRIWHAAALGLLDRLTASWDQTPLPSTDDITHAFWSACHGGQRTTAEYLLLHHGADINWVGYDDLTPLDAAERTGAPELATWLRDHGARSADTATPPAC